MADIYLYANHDWNYTDDMYIDASDATPFCDPVYQDKPWYLNPDPEEAIKLHFCADPADTDTTRNAFQTATTLFAYAETYDHASIFDNATALFATCNDEKSYGVLEDHEDFHLSTVKYGNYETAKFDYFYINNPGHEAPDTFYFDNAAVTFSIRSQQYGYAFAIGFNSHVTVTNGSEINVSNGVHINNNGLLLIKEDSKFNADSISMENATLSIKDSTLNVNSIVMNRLNSTITMNSSSVIVAESITLNIAWATGDSSTIEVDVPGSSADDFAYKVFSLTNRIETGPVTSHPFKVMWTGTDVEAGEIKLVEVKDGTQTIRYEYWATNMGDLPNTKDKVYVNSTWSSETQLSGGTIYGFNAFDKVADAVNEAPLPIFVVGGTYGTSNAPTFNGIETTIEAGTFATSVCGGKLYAAEADLIDPKDSGDISFRIEGGTFEKAVFAGDRVNTAPCGQRRTGNIEVTISGGTFKNGVGGAMALTSSAPSASAELIGDVSLTITGGTFVNDNNKGWIYGGSVASTKAIGANTTIMGNVTVTLDATIHNITVANLVVGSYGAGKIGTQDNKKDAKLVLTGNHDITATGEIWGGCSGDFITIKDGKRVMEESKVSGNRILSFTGFSGTLASGANKIRAFSDIEFKDGSEAKLGGCINLSDTTNWSFESGSSLTGDFINDFEGDTLNLTGFTGSGTFMSDSNASNMNDIFNGFEALGAIQLNGVTQSKTYSSTETTMTWTLSGGGSVVVDKTAGTMSFIA